MTGTDDVQLIAYIQTFGLGATSGFALAARWGGGGGGVRWASAGSVL